MTYSKIFLEELNKYHLSDNYNTEVERWLHLRYAEILNKKKGFDFSVPFFSPSSAGKGDLELYLKNKRVKKTPQEVSPSTRRGFILGTNIGSMIQTEILKMMAAKKGGPVRLKVTKAGPLMEDWIFKTKKVHYDGVDFSIMGQGDGILEINGEDVILEIKSVQNKSQFDNMYEAKQDHIDQCVCYSEMYGIKKAIILYVSTSREWNPNFNDLKAYDVEITPSDRDRVLSKFSRIVKLKEFPSFSFWEWRFSDYKEYIAKVVLKGKTLEDLSLLGVPQEIVEEIGSLR